MFCTAATFEVPVRTNQELQYWTDVRLAFQTPYFLVSFLTHEKPQNCEQNVITVFCFYLLDVMAVASEYEIVQLALLAPVEGAKPGVWEMETISEIWFASEPGLEAEDTAHIYVTDTGSRYVESSRDIDEAELINLRMIFPVQRHRGTEGFVTGAR